MSNVNVSHPDKQVASEPFLKKQKKSTIVQGQHVTMEHDPGMSHKQAKYVRLRILETYNNHAFLTIWSMYKLKQSK